MKYDGHGLGIAGGGGAGGGGGGGGGEKSLRFQGPHRVTKTRKKRVFGVLSQGFNDIFLTIYFFGQ